MIKKQFTLYLENKPGTLAAVTKRLAAAGVNIEGISVSETTDVGLVQVVVNKAEETVSLLKKTQVPYTVQDVALLPLKHEPGALARVMSRLSAAKVNVNYVYGTGCVGDGSSESYIVISAPNLKSVEKAWRASR